MSVREHDFERAECPCGGDHYFADHDPGGDRDAPTADGEGARSVRARTLLSPSWYGVYICVLLWAAIFWVALTGWSL